MMGRALAALLAFWICPCHADLLLLTEDKPPFNYVDASSGQVAGLSIDILREAAVRAGVTVSRVALLPMTRAIELARTQGDTCVFPILRTTERESHFQWIGPYTQNTWSFYARDEFEGRINSLDDALRFSIGSDLGSAKTAYLKSLGFSAMSLVAVDPLNAKKLSVGRFDLWLVGLYDGKIFAERYGIKNIKPVFDVAQVDYYLACNVGIPGSTVAGLNSALASMKANGFTQRAETYYLGKFHIPVASTRQNGSSAPLR